jgi:hypothetical protein
VVALAAGATVVAAAAVGVASDTLVSRAPEGPLQLKTVSASQLEQMGIRLVAASAPPYCALSEGAQDRGWAQGAVIGCPISRGAAERNARGGGNTVVESAMARATMRSDANIGQDHLVWVVVVRGPTGITGCQPLASAGGSRPQSAVCSGAAACRSLGTATGNSSLASRCVAAIGAPRILLLDGSSGALLYGTWSGGAKVLLPARSAPSAPSVRPAPIASPRALPNSA